MEAVKQTIENISEKVAGTSNAATNGSASNTATNGSFEDEQRVAIVTGAAVSVSGYLL